MDITVHHDYTLCRGWKAMRNRFFEQSQIESKPEREPKWLEQRLGPPRGLLHVNEDDTNRSQNAEEMGAKLGGPSSRKSLSANAENQTNNHSEIDEDVHTSHGTPNEHAPSESLSIATMKQTPTAVTPSTGDSFDDIDMAAFCQQYISIEVDDFTPVAIEGQEHESNPQISPIFTNYSPKSSLSETETRVNTPTRKISPLALEIAGKLDNLLDRTEDMVEQKDRAGRVGAPPSTEWDTVRHIRQESEVEANIQINHLEEKYNQEIERLKQDCINQTNKTDEKEAELQATKLDHARTSELLKVKESLIQTNAAALREKDVLLEKKDTLLQDYDDILKKVHKIHQDLEVSLQEAKSDLDDHKAWLRTLKDNHDRNCEDETCLEQMFNLHEANNGHQNRILKLSHEKRKLLNLLKEKLNAIEADQRTIAQLRQGLKETSICLDNARELLRSDDVKGTLLNIVERSAVEKATLECETQKRIEEIQNLYGLREKFLRDWEILKNNAANLAYNALDNIKVRDVQIETLKATIEKYKKDRIVSKAEMTALQEKLAKPEEKMRMFKANVTTPDGKSDDVSPNIKESSVQIEALPGGRPILDQQVHAGGAGFVIEGRKISETKEEQAIVTISETEEHHDLNNQSAIGHQAREFTRPSSVLANLLRPKINTTKARSKQQQIHPKDSTPQHPIGDVIDEASSKKMEVIPKASPQPKSSTVQDILRKVGESKGMAKEEDNKAVRTATDNKPIECNPPIKIFGGEAKHSSVPQAQTYPPLNGGTFNFAVPGVVAQSSPDPKISEPNNDEPVSPTPDSAESPEVETTDPPPKPKSTKAQRREAAKLKAEAAEKAKADTEAEALVEVEVAVNKQPEVQIAPGTSKKAKRNQKKKGKT